MPVCVGMAYQRLRGAHGQRIRCNQPSCVVQIIELAADSSACSQDERSICICNENACGQYRQLKDRFCCSSRRSKKKYVPIRRIEITPAMFRGVSAWTCLSVTETQRAASSSLATLVPTSALELTTSTAATVILLELNRGVRSSAGRLMANPTLSLVMCEMLEDFILKMKSRDDGESTTWMV